MKWAIVIYEFFFFERENKKKNLFVIYELRNMFYA